MDFECISNVFSIGLGWVPMHFPLIFDGSCNEFQLMLEGIVDGCQCLLDGFQCILVRFPWHLGWISMHFEWIPNAFSVDFQCILDRFP